jgi:hypothetical protein
VGAGPPPDKWNRGPSPACEFLDSFSGGQDDDSGS